MGLSSPQRRLLDEMAMTTGAIAMVPGAAGAQKKQPKRPKPYRADPVTGEPKKGRKKAGKVLKDNLAEAMDDALSSMVYDADTPEQRKKAAYHNLLKFYAEHGKDSTLTTSLAQEFFEILKMFAEIFLQDSPFYTTIKDMYLTHKYSNKTLARRDVESPFGIRGGLGIYKPTRWSNLDFAEYIKALWWRAVKAYEEQLLAYLRSVENASKIRGRTGDLITKDIIGGTRQFLDNTNSQFPDLMTIYNQFRDEQNAQLNPKLRRAKERETNPRQRRKFTIPGDPKVYPGESYADAHPGCQTCARATKARELCPTGRKNYFDKGLMKNLQSLADIGLHYDITEPGLLDKLTGRGARVRRRYRPGENPRTD